MGRDGLQVGIQIRKFVIITARICYRSVRSHPLLLGTLLFLLFLYRSSPFLFSILVSFSPVLVCAAVLLGTLLSFGESKFPLIDEDERTSAEIVASKTKSVENSVCFEKDENIGGNVGFTESRKDIVQGTIDEQPLVGSIDRANKFENDRDCAHSSMPADQNSRDIQFVKQEIDEVNSEIKSLEREQKAGLNDEKIEVGVDVSSSHGEVLENGLSGKSLAENFEDYKSAEGSVDYQGRDHLDSSVEAWERNDDSFEDGSSMGQKFNASPSHEGVLENSESENIESQDFEDNKSVGSTDVQVGDQLDSPMRSLEPSDNVLEDRLSPVQKVQAAVLAQLRNHLESSLGSWNGLDMVVENRSGTAQKVQTENSEDYKSAEGSFEAQITEQLESSFRSWNQLGSDNDDDDDDDDDESDSGSDGAESSSPDASMADIIPMLDELHPLLDDENQQAGNISLQSSAATGARSGKSYGGSIHSDDETDQKEEGGGGIKSDADDDDDDNDDDDDDDEDTQGSKEDADKSPISWTEDDQKNLMDLGSSEVERNQRLESLIARRRARRMMAERNILDFDSMDLQFPIAPISTTRHNPFDFPHESYDDLGLPPIPGSAPSILQPRRNPFDLPYDSSEEKPDLMGDSFQQEFMELCQGESSNQTEPVFRRNETFSIVSSMFSFGRYAGRDSFRPSRFRPYFVPERTDSDVMSYSSSLQRQPSEISESKVSSAAETESTTTDVDEDVNKPGAQEMEPNSEIDQASVPVELGSQSSDDLHSLSHKENEFVLQVPEIELGGTGNARDTISNTLETQSSDEITMVDQGKDPQPESWMPDRETSASAMEELIEEKQSTTSSSSSSSSSPKGYNDERVDVNESLVSREHSDNIENLDMLVKHPLETSTSDIPSEHSIDSSDFHHRANVWDNHSKEPIYDSSPQAFEKRHSSSSMSSDLHKETSEINLFQVSSVQRGLLMTEEPIVHDEDARQIVQDEKQVVDFHDLSMKQNEEGDEHGISDQFRFSEVPVNSQNEEGDGHEISDQSRFSEVPVNSQNEEGDGLEISVQFRFSEVPVNSEALVAPEYELSLSTDDKVSEDEGRHDMNQEDDAGICMEGKLDVVVGENAEGSAVHDNFSKDVILTERDTSVSEYSISSVQPALSPITAESREEAKMEKEEDEVLLPSTSNMVNHDNDMVEKLVSVLDGDHDFPHDTAIDYPSDNSEKQELSIICSRVEEVGQINDTDGTFNKAPIQDSMEDILPDPLQNGQPSSEPEKLGNKLAADLDVKELVDDITTHEVGLSEGEEKMMYDFGSNIKDMNEELLSELDAVGDFSLRDIGANLNMSMTYSNAALDSDAPDQILGESQSNTIASLDHDALLGANIDVPNFEPMKEITEVSRCAIIQDVLDSHARDATTGLLLQEAQSVEDIDTAFDREGERDFQKPDSTESSGVELTRELVEASYPENESIPKDTEPETYAMDIVSPVDDISSDHNQSVEKASDRASIEGQNLDSEAEVPEVNNEDLEKTVQTETGECSVDEATQIDREDEAEVGFLEQLHMNRDIKEMPESLEQARVVEGIIAPAVESSSQVETFGFVESESLQKASDTDEIQESHLAEVSIAPAADSEDQIERASSLESVSSLMVRVGSLESSVVETSIASSLDVEGQVGVTVPADNEDELKPVGLVEPPVEERIISSIKCEDQVGMGLLADNENEIEGVGSPESPIIEASIIPSIDHEDIVGGVVLPTNDDVIKRVGSAESPVLEVSNIFSIDSQDQLGGVGSLESGSLPNVEDSEQKRGPSVGLEIVARAIDAENQVEEFGSVESKSLPVDGDKEVQELAGVEDIGPPESEDQKDGFVSEESELFHIDREAKELQESHVEEASDAPCVEFKADTERDSLVEVKSLGIESIGTEAAHESPVVEASVGSSVESEYQAETVGSVESRISQIDSDINAIQESLIVESGVKSAVKTEDHQLASPKQSENILVAHAEDLAPPPVSESTSKESGGQGSDNSNTEKPSLQVDESGLHESHLKPASSST